MIPQPLVCMIFDLIYLNMGPKPQTNGNNNYHTLSLKSRTSTIPANILSVSIFISSVVCVIYIWLAGMFDKGKHVFSTYKAIQYKYFRKNRHKIDISR